MATRNRKIKATGADMLAEQLRQDILQGSWQVGDFYATEEELVQRHQVTRGVVREAVSRLRALGILTGRKNKGLLIDSPDPIRLLEQVSPFFVRSGKDLHQIAGLRYNLLVGAVDAAVENATDEQMARLTSLAREWDECVLDDSKVSRGFEIATEINCLILEMTGNPLIYRMRPVIEEFFRITRWHENAWPKHIHANSWHYRELAANLARRNAETARSIIRINLGYLIHQPVSHWDTTLATRNEQVAMDAVKS